MLAVSILAILAIPASVLIVAEAFRRLLRDMLQHQEATFVVGGQPLSLIRAQMAEQADAAREMRVEQRELMEKMKERRLSALGD